MGIVLFWGLSYIHAVDTNAYIQIFYLQIKPLSQGLMVGPESRDFEVGYVLLGQLCKTIVPHYWFFQLVVFFWDMLFILKGFQKLFDKNIVLCLIPLLFFFYPTLLGAFRQGIAVSIFIYALHIIDEHKSWRYFIWILIASLFHQSALLLVIVYLAKFLKPILSRDWVIILMLLICDVFFITGKHLSLDLDVIMQFLTGGSLEMGSKYSDYINGLYEEGAKDFGLFKIIEINIVVLLYTFYVKNDRSYLLMRFNLLLYVMISSMVGGFFAHRLNYYWAILYYVCFIRGVMSVGKDEAFRYIEFVAIACYFIWFFILKSGYIINEYNFMFNY